MFFGLQRQPCSAMLWSGGFVMLTSFYSRHGKLVSGMPFKLGFMFCFYIIFGYPTPLANILAGILDWFILQRLEAEHVLFDCQAIKFFFQISKINWGVSGRDAQCSLARPEILCRFQECTGLLSTRPFSSTSVSEKLVTQNILAAFEALVVDVALLSDRNVLTNSPLPFPRILCCKNLWYPLYV